MEDYKVKLEVFEGPLDLLLYLIKRDEVDIYDISIERTFKNLKLDLVVFHWALGPRESALDRFALLLRAVFVVILFACFELADLAGKFVHHFVDGHIQIGLGILCVDIGSCQSEMDFHVVGFFSVVIVEQNDVRGDELFAMTFKVADFFGHKFIDGTSEG